MYLYYSQRTSYFTSTACNTNCFIYSRISFRRHPHSSYYYKINLLDFIAIPVLILLPYHLFNIVFQNDFVHGADSCIIKRAFRTNKYGFRNCADTIGIRGILFRVVIHRKAVAVIKVNAPESFSRRTAENTNGIPSPSEYIKGDYSLQKCNNIIHTSYSFRHLISDIISICYVAFCDVVT